MRRPPQPFPRAAIALAVVLAAAAGCHDRSGGAGPPDPAPPLASGAAPGPPSPPPASTALPPLGGSWSEELPVEGFGDATVSVPLGATSPRPVMIGVHGRGDRPGWACGSWRGVTNAYPFIVCPHGVPARAGPTVGLAFADAPRLVREIEGGLRALRARFGRYVAEGPMIYAGFSQGAFLGTTIVADDPARFPVAVLAEGGQPRWTAEHAARFARGGGKRVLFACSTAACDGATSPALAALRRAGVEAKMCSAGHIGHGVDDRVVTAIRAEWPWVVAGLGGAW